MSDAGLSRRWPPRASAFLGAAAALCVAGFFLLPLATAWPWALVQTPTESISIPVDWRSLTASLIVAALAAVLAVALGAAFAAGLTLADLPGRSLLATALLAPFLAPPTVWALGQVYCYGAGGLVERWLSDGARPLLNRWNTGQYAATTLVLAQIYAPLAMLLVVRGLRALHQAGLEAARLSLTPWQLARWIVRGLRLELAAGWLLAFALGLGNFAVPHVLQCKLYTVEIYMRNANYLDQVGALAYSTPLLLVALVAAALVGLMDRRASFALGAASARQAWHSGGKRWLVLALLVGYLIAVGLLPLAALVYECRSLAHFASAFKAAAPEIENTLLISAAAAGLAMLGGAVVGVTAARRRWLALESVSLAQLGVPTLVLGLCWLWFYNRSGALDALGLADTSLLVVLGLAARAWPFTTRLASLGVRRQAPAWQEAAVLNKLSFWRRWWWIDLPLLGEHLAAAAVVAFVLSAGDVELSQMLCAPGSGTLALRLFTFLHFGPAHVAAGLALLQLMVSLVPVLAYFLWTDRNLEVV